jgi:hypothetical protein
MIVLKQRARDTRLGAKHKRFEAHVAQVQRRCRATEAIRQGGQVRVRRCTWPSQEMGRSEGMCGRGSFDREVRGR